MQRKYVLLIFLLCFGCFITGCQKTIKHGDKVWWQPKNKRTNNTATQQSWSGEDVFFKKNNYDDFSSIAQSRERRTMDDKADSLEMALNKNSHQSVMYGNIYEKGKVDKKPDNTEDKKQQPSYININVINNQNDTTNKDNKDVPSQQQTLPVKSEPAVAEKPVIQEHVAKQPVDTKTYKIQCGYYYNENTAKKVANKIRSQGIGDVNVVTKNGKSRILVGNFKTKTDGQVIWEKLSKLNYLNDRFWTTK